MPGIQFNRSDMVLFIYDESTKQICDYSVNDAETKGRLGKVLHFEPHVLLVEFINFPEKGKILSIPEDRFEQVKVVNNTD